MSSPDYSVFLFGNNIGVNVCITSIRLTDTAVIVKGVCRMSRMASPCGIPESLGGGAVILIRYLCNSVIQQNDSAGGWLVF